MSVSVAKWVTPGEDDTWDFHCPGIADSACGGEVPFASTGWPTKKAAEARGQEHIEDHLGKAPMSTLEDFRAKHGLGVKDDGKAVRLEDL